jgi:hypothetical protein
VRAIVPLHRHHHAKVSGEDLAAMGRLGLVTAGPVLDREVPVQAGLASADRVVLSFADRAQTDLDGGQKEETVHPLKGSAVLVLVQAPLLPRARQNVVRRARAVPARIRPGSSTTCLSLTPMAMG